MQIELQRTFYFEFSLWVQDLFVIIQTRVKSVNLLISFRNIYLIHCRLAKDVVSHITMAFPI